MERCRLGDVGRQCKLTAGHSGDCEPHSPRASSELPQPYWDATGKCTRCGAQGNSYQACVNCFGLSRNGLSQGLAQQQASMAAYNQRQNQKQIDGLRVDPRRTRSEYDTEIAQLQQALAASEKERERLKAIVDAKCDLNDAALLDERNKLRRELENLKRSAASTIHDLSSQVEISRESALNDGLRCEFLKRELDRERAKNKKRGL